MLRFAPPLALLTTLVLAALLAGCGDGSADDPDAPVSFASELVALETPAGVTGFVPTLEGPLRVLSASPFGAMAGQAPNQAISVTFSRPMVPLGRTPEPAADALTLRGPDGPVAGALRWQGTQTLVFQPDSLVPATNYTATLAAGLTSVEEDALANPYTWTFETPRPVLVASEPSRGAQFADPGAPIRLFFSLPVEADRVRRFIELRREGSTSLNVRVEQAGDSSVVVSPNSDLAKGAAYRVRTSPEMPAAVGTLGTAEATEFGFRTYGDFELERVRQGYGRSTGPVAPDRAIRLSFSTPVRFEALRQALSFSPAIELPAGIEARDAVESTEHSLRLPLDPETRYTLTLGEGLTDVFGQTITTRTTAFRTAALTPTLRMPTGLLVIEADRERAVPLRVTNIDAVNVGFERFTPADLIRKLPAYDDRHWYGPFPEDYEAPEPVAASRRVPLAIDRNRPTYVPLALDSLLDGENGGLVGVHLRYQQEGNERVRVALAQVTTLGLTAKFSPHQNLFFVTTLADAQPVEGAAVTVYDDAGTELWQGTSNARGIAESPGWAALGLEKRERWETPVQYAFVEHEGQVAFTSSRFDDGIEPYRFDIDLDWSPEPLTYAGTVFSDRGLYRAGETAHLKGILRGRTDGDWVTYTDSVRVLVTDSRDEVVVDRRLQPSAYGSFDLTYLAPTDASLGVYQVRVVRADDDEAEERESWQTGDLAQGTFRVDAFRAATFAVDAVPAARAFVAGDFFEGTVTGRYLFGAAMGGQALRYRLVQQNGRYTPPGYDAYRFGIARGYYSLYETLAQGDTVLTADGTKQLRVPLPGNERGAPASLQFSATVTDPSRQEQSDQTTVTLHPGLFYIGLKPETTFLDLSRDQVMALDVATVDPNGAPVGAENLTVELIRQQWNSVREVGGDGRLRWRSERTEEVVGSRTVETEAGRAVRLRMPVRLGGSYIVRATGYDVRGNVIKTEAYFYATGAGYVAWERSDDDHLELVADKKSYAPGETARILVPSPYEQATALVTVEREGIISSRVVEVEGSAPQIEVPLGEQHLPNAFVSVILLSGRTAQPSAGEDLGAPSFKIGYVNLPVSAQGRHLTVEVEPGSETYEPGGSVTVDLRLTDDGGRGVEGEIAFAAADAGVLNLIGYAMPDPFQTFYGPRALGVTTSETLANLVEQRDFGEKEEDEGGGGGEDADRLLRSDFRPLAHWAPAIRTDGSGRATVTFELPENLTTFRLMAVGLTRDHRFGQGQTDIVVTKPLVLQPALPRFARLGDTFEAGVLVTNRTGQAGPAVVTARADGIALDGEARRTVTLAKGETREVRFAWDIEQLGTANLRFTAELGSERDGLEVPLDIALPVTKEASATFASTADAAREALVLPSDRVPGVGQVEVRVASTAMVGLDGATRYLFQYPYGCLEQRTSRIRPLLVADDLLDLFDLDALDGDRASVVNEWLGSLDAYWMGRGFALWKGGRFVSPYATAYAVLALAEAEAAGFDVPQPLTREAVDALATLVKDSSLQPDYYTRDVWDTSRALMLYALARHDRVLEAEVQALAERYTQPTATPSAELQSHLLRTIALAGRGSLNGYAQPLADGLRGRTTTEGTTAYLAAQTGDAWGWIFSSDVRSTAFGMTALIEAPTSVGGPSSDVRQLTERMVQYLIRSRTTGHWASTQENAAVLDALRAYQAAFETTDPNFTATVQLAGREVLNASFRGRSLTAEEATVDPTAMPSGEALPIEVTVDGTGRAYYSLLAETYTSAPVEAANRGLAVQRTIQRLDGSGNAVGNAVTTSSGTLTLDAGQLVRVTLRLTSPATRNYVVVDDALPAGLEALNPAFQTSGVLAQQQTGSGQWWGSFNHTELRDDRVLLFADYLRRGEHTYTYLARATTPGTFVHPPAQAELMYEPEVNGRTATGTVVVRPAERVGA